ncbi:MAG: dihydropteroate synthase [Dehalococcoidales bacterium]|nr:dihydropteroate synthase [Dehalococcoidales bacterium]
METRVTGKSGKEVIISYDKPTVIIGERINPAANKKYNLALTEGGDYLDIVRKEAVRQVELGADMVDINCSAFGVDEVGIMPQAVQAAQEVVDVPLCIDSNNPEAILAGLKVYLGKPLVNSVSGETPSITRVIPMIKEYGAAVVGLVQDDEGVPSDDDKRLKTANYILETAMKAGIAKEDVLIDCLAFAVGANTDSGPFVLKAIQRVRDELGLNQTIGASNISFGLPDRETLNTAFLPMIMERGVTCLITSAKKATPVVRGVDLILGRDKRAMRYMKNYRERTAAAKK